MQEECKNIGNITVLGKDASTFEAIAFMYYTYKNIDINLGAALCLRAALALRQALEQASLALQQRYSQLKQYKVLWHHYCNMASKTTIVE
jgi:hypothetical protein